MPTQKLSQTLRTMSHEELLEHLQKSLKELGGILVPNEYRSRKQLDRDLADWAEKFYEEMIK